MEVDDKPNLWIEVPLTPPTPPVESPPLATTPPHKLTPDPIDFERLRELPTPVVNNGLFVQGELVLSKPRKNPIQLSPPRVLLEYKPVMLDRSNSVGSKRVTLQPLVQGLGRAHSLKQPLTPMRSPEPDLPKMPNYVGHVLEAPHTGTKYHVTHNLGRGNFSTVVCAQLALGRMAAVKIIRIPPTPARIANFKAYFVRELNVLSQLHHPCVVELVDYSTNLAIDPEDLEGTSVFKRNSLLLDLAVDLSQPNPQDLQALVCRQEQFIFVNYCRGGNLFQLMVSHSLPPNNNHAVIYWRIIYRIAQELIAAVSYLHKHDIVHRDIKLENVLLTHEYEEMVEMISEPGKYFNIPFINLADFGLLKRLSPSSEMLSTRCGLTDYVPPEVLMGLEYDGRLTDLWSVGVVLYVLIEHRLPFDPVPAEALSKAGISPSVIRRKMAKNSPSHRIAMIDWQWFKDSPQDDDTYKIETNLKRTVDGLLVRKDKRKHVSEFADTTAVPPEFFLG